MLRKRIAILASVGVALAVSGCGAAGVYDAPATVPAAPAEPPVFKGYTELEMATELENGDWGNDFMPAVVDNVICTEKSSNKFVCDGDYISEGTQPAKWNVTVTKNGQWIADPIYG